MAIEVGSLLVAIQADDTPLKRALAEVDRLSKGYADRAAFYQKAVTQARTETREAQKALNAEQKQFNKLLAESNARAKKNIANTKEQNLAMLEQYQRARRAERELKGKQSALDTAISMRDENRLEKQRAREKVSAARTAAKANIDAMKEEADVEKRIAKERERYRKRELAERQSTVNNHIAELQRRERLEIDSDRRVARERERLRKRELAERKAAITQQLNQRLGPLGTVQAQALPPGMRLRGGQLVPMVAPPQQMPALPPGMQLRGGRLVPIVSPARPARQAGSFGSPGLSTFGITSTLVATAGIAELARTANEMQIVQQRLAQVSSSGAEATLAFDRLAKGAQRLRQPLGETVELYTKLRQSNQNVGMSANETIKVTEAFSAALRISGATGQTAASSLLQFGQAMAKGKLDGDEFRTVAENASEVLRVLERQTGFSRGELLKMREEGKLTARMMADALIKEYDNLIDRATRLAPSLSQGATALRNSLLIAMTNTHDAREAIETLARKMIDLADIIQENGPLLFSIGKFAAGMFLISKGLDAAKNSLLAFRTLAALGIPGIGPVVAVASGVAGVNAYGTFKAAERKRAEEDEIKNTTKLNEANKVREKLINRVVAAQKKYNEETSGTLRGGRSAKAAKEELARSMELLKMAGEHMNALREMSTSPIVTRANAGSGGASGKAASDDTEQEIANLLALYEAGELNEAGLARLTELRDEAQSTLMRLADTESYTKEQALQHANALERVTRIREVLDPMVEMDNEVLEEKGALLKALNDNYDNLTAAMKRMADQLTKEEIVNAGKELHKAQEDLLIAVASIDKDKTAALLAKIVELQAKIKELQGKLYERDAMKMGTGGKPTDGEEGDKKWWEDAIDGIDRHTKRLGRSILDTFLSAPSELISAYFTDMANAIANGGAKAGEAMRQALAGIASKSGQQMIEMGMAKLTKVALSAYGKMMAKMGTTTSVFGKFLLKIQAMLKNPLVAGAALIALGVGLAAYGAKMGAVGSGGSDLGGGIGGLGVGSYQNPAQIYRFGDRSSPVAPGQTPAQPPAPITVNATIIGPNDPKAQRDIAMLVDNAARRGLVRGSGGRTI